MKKNLNIGRVKIVNNAYPSNPLSLSEHTPRSLIGQFPDKLWGLGQYYKLTAQAGMSDSIPSFQGTGFIQLIVLKWARI